MEIKCKECGAMAKESKKALVVRVVITIVVISVMMITTETILKPEEFNAKTFVKEFNIFNERADELTAVMGGIYIDNMLKTMSDKEAIRAVDQWCQLRIQLLPRDKDVIKLAGQRFMATRFSFRPKAIE